MQLWIPVQLIYIYKKSYTQVAGNTEDEWDGLW